MVTDEKWAKFTKSGKIEDYLEYVNSSKENGNTGGNTSTIYHSRVGNQGNERG
ncbi:MAG: hypothetical protein ACOYJS_02055 [Acutalibacteraceae bacterium]|jgi:hypothetical protein